MPPTVNDKEFSKFFVLLLSSAGGFWEGHQLTGMLQGWGAQPTKLGFMAAIPHTLGFIDLIDEQHCSAYLHKVCPVLLVQHLTSEKKKVISPACSTTRGIYFLLSTASHSSVKSACDLKIWKEQYILYHASFHKCGRNSTSCLLNSLFSPKELCFVIRTETGGWFLHKTKQHNSA